jgi:hypothetical protein
MENENNKDKVGPCHFFKESDLVNRGKEIKNRLDDANKNSFLWYYINTRHVQSYGIGKSFIYSELNSFLQSDEFKKTLEIGLEYIIRKQCSLVTSDNVVQYSKLGKLYKDRNYIIFDNKTAFSYMERNETGSEVRFEILYKVKDNEDGTILCKGKHFATIYIVNSYRNRNNSIESFIYSSILSKQSSQMSESSLRLCENIDFESYYNYIAKTSDIVDAHTQNMDNVIYSYSTSFKGNEGFIESVKFFGRKIIKTIIHVIRIIIDWIKNVILRIGRFIRDKIFYKMFGMPKSKTILENISYAYDIYENLPITWTESKSAESSSFIGEDIPVSHVDESIEPLSDHLKKNVRYMNFKKDNFDIINRVSAVTTSAVDSISQCLTRNMNTDNILRNYGVIYGNKNEEEIYSQYQRDNYHREHISPLYFYHEKAFMEFIFYIDKLTNGNLKDLITKREYYKQNKNFGNTIENKINLNIDGNDVADAIILNCSLSDLNKLKKRAENINPEKITIKDVISKDILLRILSGNSVILDKLSQEASSTLDTNERLSALLEKFHKHLEEIDNRLNMIQDESINNFVTIQEIQDWIVFIAKFTNRFMTYRLDMIHIIRRVLKILAYKTSDKKIKEFLIRDGTSNNSILGIINLYTNETFKNLPYAKLVEESKYISQKHMKNMYYNNKFPICIIPIKEYGSEIKFFEESVGFTIPVFDRFQSYLFKKIHNALNLNFNEKTLVDLFIQFDKQPYDGKLIGSIILINVNTSSINGGNDKYFPHCINYYGYIIHETTHAIRMCNEIKKSVDFNDIIAHGTDRLEKKIKRERIDKFETEIRNNINRDHLINSYYLSNNESEAFKEQYNFLMSTIENRDIEYKKKTDKFLKTRFIHGIYYNPYKIKL